MILDTFICVRCLLFKDHVACGGKERIIILAQSREVPKTYTFFPDTTLKKAGFSYFTMQVLVIMTDRKSGSSEKDVKTAAKQLSDKDIKVTLTQFVIVHVLEDCLVQELS